MAITKALTLTTTPQDVAVQSVCSTITIKEDESVANWPTTAIIIKKPATGDANTLTAGKSYQFQCPTGQPFTPGKVLGQVYLPSGSTTGIQDEQ